jgi:hypothetical protein
LYEEILQTAAVTNSMDRRSDSGLGRKCRWTSAASCRNVGYTFKFSITNRYAQIILQFHGDCNKGEESSYFIATSAHLATDFGKRRTANRTEST